MPVYKPSSRKNHCSYHNFRYSVGFRVNGGLLGYHTWLSPRRPRARKHPRDSGSSPDSGIFFCFLRPRVCVRAPARVWGPWGLCARAARVWGFGGVFCLWGFGAGWGARGACGGPVTRVEGGGFDFFLPKKGPTGPVSAGPAGPRRDHAGAKARGAAPAPRRARAAGASCLYAASAPSVMNATDGDDGRLADGRRRRSQY